jgi:hypothetical protein
VTAPLRAAANWYPDPLGRGEYRDWDGEQWTQWIATGGTTRPDTFDLPADLPEPTLLSQSLPPPLPGAYPVDPYAPGTQPARLDTLRFRSLQAPAIALTWLLGASILAAVVAAILTFSHLSKVEDAFDNPTISNVQSANDAADAVNGVGGVVELLSIAIFVLLVVLLFRASKNTELWNHESRTWRPGWAIAGWFIPIANFVIPFLVTRDVWRRTPPEDTGTGILWVWWLLFLIGAIAFRVEITTNTLSEHRTEDWLHIVGALAYAGAAIPLIVMVRSLATRQRDTAFPSTEPT